MDVVPDQLYTYTDGVKRTDAGSPFISSIIPSISRVDTFLGTRNELSVRVDMSLNGQLYTKEHFNKGKDMKFRFHRAPSILNATCQNTEEGRCLGNTLFEQGGSDIHVWAKDVWHTESLRCKFTSETEEKVVEAISQYKNVYLSVSSFLCKAPKMRRGVVVLGN